ncbi:hypothetical protein SAMN02745127_01342 [Oceanospirillum multiglobuliferum]|uniref:hypothetical protein n=1 Tax=Oceanospirillum multiglobuliferum TaxID=64969 RepID=UPI0009D4AB18|nr:hypothetical protein [Oceanospirillum multiglobuliferum]SJZ85990.1 hypothetical protein SAMN02745127_01342 [Oceanospirillum multiglobuliferum]
MLLSITRMAYQSDAKLVVVCGLCARRNRMQHHYQNAIQWSDRLINTFTTQDDSVVQSEALG